MPFVSIRIVKEVLERAGPEKQHEMVGGVTEAIAESMGLDPELIWDSVEPIPAVEWYVNGDSVRNRWDAAGKS